MKNGHINYLTHEPNLIHFTHTALTLGLRVLENSVGHVPGALPSATYTQCTPHLHCASVFRRTLPAATALTSVGKSDERSLYTTTPPDAH